MTQSEGELDTELERPAAADPIDAAAAAESAGYVAEGSARDRGLRRAARVGRIAELRRIRDLESFPTQLQVESFGDLEVLEQRRVQSE